MHFPQQDPLIARIEEIVKTQRILAQELSLLNTLRSQSESANNVLLPEDRLNSKNAQKFEVLSHTLAVLGQGDAYLYGGLGTKQLFEAVSQRLCELQLKLAAYNRDRSKRQEYDPGSPLLQPDAVLNYSTFRSHLKRFGEEGRLHYDDERQLWRTTADIPAEALEPPSEDDEYDAP
ncbi:MAG: hypothetical protein AAFR53_14385 [Pseudomonadota bacterium]